MHPLEQFKYCPKCGSAFAENNGKSKKCTACGFVYYFNPSAATVGLIFNSRRELLVCRRAKEPAKGTLDLPGGFLDLYETGEEGVAREVFEETGLRVLSARYLFSLPNTYEYSGFLVHTLDLFYVCQVKGEGCLQARDDVSDTFFVPLAKLEPDAFGLHSIREGIKRLLDTFWCREPEK